MGSRAGLGVACGGSVDALSCNERSAKRTMIDTLWIPAIAKKLYNSVDLRTGELARWIKSNNRFKILKSKASTPKIDRNDSVGNGLENRGMKDLEVKATIH
ncbi:hypothetical protein U1Q18_025573, partial [Sarracenia purpurea var. burkii]